MRDRAKAYAAAILHSVIIGLSFMFVKMTLGFTTPLDLLFYRFVLAFVCACAPILAGRAGPGIAMRDVPALLPLAVFYPILFFLAQTYGLSMITSAGAGIIQSLVPIITLVMANLILGETSNLRQKACVSLCVLGVLLISFMSGTGGTSFNPAGAGLILASAVSQSFYNVLVRRVSGRYAPYSIALMTNSLGFAVFSAIAVYRHIGSGTIVNIFDPLKDIRPLIGVIYLGALSSFGTSMLIGYALSKIETFKVSVINNFATVITLCAGAFFLDEIIQWYHIVGAVMIISGVLGCNYFVSVKQTREDLDVVP
ncbi:MAG: DMT family transporter [Synergistaceae bacterium]|jgi:drug/metabolite transporter (DMT)-like permease|nr:DMT family transporter [Synergistaceae bacterium]